MIELGKLMGTMETKKEPRDAIHVAITPVYHTYRNSLEVRPGDHIGLIRGDDEVAKENSVEKIGIVDPFLPKDIEIPWYTWFWMLVYPNTVTAMKHFWEHHAFLFEDKRFLNDKG